MNPTDTPHAPCGCHAADTVDAPRRRVIRIAAVGLAAPLAVATRPAVAAVIGDRLVEEDAEGAPHPLRAGDLKPSKPVLAFPFDAQSGKRRDETRLNKVVLVRVPEADMTPATRSRAAGGVVAYSAICTHQACDVKTWMSKERVLVCFCHSTKFNLFDDGKVLSGPALRSLPSLPIKLEGDLLVVAGPFSTPPGGNA